MASFTKSEWLSAQLHWRARRHALIAERSETGSKPFRGILVEVAVRSHNQALSPLLAELLAQVRPDISVVAAGSSALAARASWLPSPRHSSPLSYAPLGHAGVISSSIEASEALKCYDVVFHQVSSPGDEGDYCLNTVEGMVPYFDASPGSLLGEALKRVTLQKPPELYASQSLSKEECDHLHQMLATLEPLAVGTPLGPLAAPSGLPSPSKPSAQQLLLLDAMLSHPGLCSHLELFEESNLLAFFQDALASPQEEETVLRLLEDAQTSGDILTLIEIAQALEFKP